MKRITLLCFLLAAASLVAAKRATVIDGSAAVVRKQVCGGPGALEEQGAVARLRELDAFFAITPSGHVVRMEMTKERAHATQELDMSFLANLRDLEDLRIIDLPITPHALDALPRLKHLARLDLSGHSVGDAHLAIIGKMRQLRKLGLRNTSITAPARAAGEPPRFGSPDLVGHRDERRCSQQHLWPGQAKEVEKPRTPMPELRCACSRPTLFTAYANWKIGKIGTNGGAIHCVLLGIKRAEQDSVTPECSARAFVH